MLIPRQNAPNLAVGTLESGCFDLTAETPSRMTLICFYRGFHCPVCSNYLKELDRLTPAFADRGVTTIAISSDTEDRARRMSQKIEFRPPAYWLLGLELSDAREWGLYISASRGESSIGIEEPALFSEPGVFLVKPDHSIYYLAVQSMAFARPNFLEIIQALDFVIKNDYPARGEYIGAI